MCRSASRPIRAQRAYWCLQHLHYWQAAVTRGDTEDTVTATETLQPKDYVDVGTQVSGQLKRLLVEIAAIIESSQLLAEIDSSVYQAKVDADRTQLHNQRAVRRSASADRVGRTAIRASTKYGA